jgi:hypothetical protein
MRLTIAGTYRGEHFEAQTLPIDLIRFERQFGKPSAALAEGYFEHVCWIAWHALHRVKHTTEGFDAWLDGVEDIEMADEVAIPLDGTATPG